METIIERLERRLKLLRGIRDDIMRERELAMRRYAEVTHNIFLTKRELDNEKKRSELLTVHIVGIGKNIIRQES